MAEAQTVLIEFQIDDTQLVSALERLEKAGAVDSQLASSFKRTTAEMSKQTAEAKRAASATQPIKKNLEDVDKATKQFTRDFVTGFNEGVTEALREAGVTAEQFSEALKTGQTEAEGSTESLRQRLKTLTAQIAELKLRGEDNTDQFKQMVIEAGNIKDAMGDAAAEIKNAGSDTQTFDNLIGSAQAVAGGFAVVQGAAALFGDESEELQETLLKVNAVMAVMQGLQQISNALEKEGALIKLANTVATKGQTAAQVLYNTVVGSSIGLMKAFRIALAATGIGLLVIGLIEAVRLLKEYATSSNDAAESQKRLNNAIANTNNALVQSNDIYVQSLNQQKTALEDQLALAEARGESELTILGLRRRIAQEEATIGKKSLENLGLTRIGVEKLDLQYSRLIQRIATLNKAAETDTSKRGQEAAETLRNQLQAEADGIKPLLDAGLQAIQQIDDAQKASSLIIIDEQKERQRISKETTLNQLNDELAALERKLLAVEAESVEELRLQQAVVNKKAEIELTNEKLSKEQRGLIRDQARKDNLTKEREFNQKLVQEEISSQIARNAAALQSLKLNQDDRLMLQISNIELAAAAEVEAANGNSAKIKEINAKRDADILAVRKQFIDDALEYELSIAEAKGGVLRRVNEEIAADEKKPLNARITAINQLAAKEIESINKRQDALKEQLDQGLISRKEYDLKYAQLLDKEVEAEEKAADKKKQIIKEVEEARIQFATQTALQVLDIISQFGQQQTEAEQIKIDNQRAEIEALREAGAITEQEAKTRQKKLDVEETKLKRKQAERDKAIAIFQAVINTAAAVARALATGGPVLAAVVGALGAAQIALIAARPIPKFGKGKKDGYQGVAEIGETGPELFEQNGKMFLADKRQLVWLAAKDKVYNPVETKEMLMPKVEKELMQWQPPVQKAEPIDYDKLGKAVGKHIKLPGFNIDEQGFKIWQQQGLNRQNYMDKRYSSK